MDRVELDLVGVNILDIRSELETELRTLEEACDPDEREFVEDLDFVLPNEFETELRTLVWVLLSSGSSLVEISETDAMMN